MWLHPALLADRQLRDQDRYITGSLRRRGEDNAMPPAVTNSTQPRLQPSCDCSPSSQSSQYHPSPATEHPPPPPLRKPRALEHRPQPQDGPGVPQLAVQAGDTREDKHSKSLRVPAELTCCPELTGFLPQPPEPASLTALKSKTRLSLQAGSTDAAHPLCSAPNHSDGWSR